MFPAGASIDPQRDGRDERRHALRLATPSDPGKPLPDGMTISATRATARAVVSVDGGQPPHGRQRRRDGHGDGDLQRRHEVAGASSCGSSLSSTTSRVNGQPLGAFTPEQHDYDVVLPDGTPSPPVVGDVGRPDATVTVTQADGVPGTATVVVTGADGTPYDLHGQLRAAGASDEFDGSAPRARSGTGSGNGQRRTERCGGALQITTEQAA